MRHRILMIVLIIFFQRSHSAEEMAATKSAPPYSLIGAEKLYEDILDLVVLLAQKPQFPTLTVIRDEIRERVRFDCAEPVDGATECGSRQSNNTSQLQVRIVEPTPFNPKGSIYFSINGEKLFGRQFLVNALAQRGLHHLDDPYPCTIQAGKRFAEQKRIVVARAIFQKGEAGKCINYAQGAIVGISNQDYFDAPIVN